MPRAHSTANRARQFFNVAGIAGMRKQQREVSLDRPHLRAHLTGEILDRFGPISLGGECRGEFHEANLS